MFVFGILKQWQCWVRMDNLNIVLSTNNVALMGHLYGLNRLLSNRNYLPSWSLFTIFIFSISGDCSRPRPWLQRRPALRHQRRGLRFRFPHRCRHWRPFRWRTSWSRNDAGIQSKPDRFWSGALFIDLWESQTKLTQKCSKGTVRSSHNNLLRWKQKSNLSKKWYARHVP